MQILHVRVQGRSCHYESGGTLAQIAQGGGGCPVPANIQGQAGQGFEPPDLVEDAPTLALDEMTFRGPP